MPLAAAWRASSGQVQRATGVPLEADISHARALTPATRRAGNTRGLPGAVRRPVPRCPALRTGAATCGPCPRRGPGRCAISWGFAIYCVSHDDYQKSVLPSGYPPGAPQEALDCACGLYLGDTTAWLDPPSPTN